MGMSTLRNYKWTQRGQSGLPRLRVPRVLWVSGPRHPGGAQRAPRNPQAAIYWRRRFVALLIGLAVLALIAWAFSGALGGSGAAAGATGGASQSGTGQQAHGGAAPGGARGAGGALSRKASSSAAAGRPGHGAAAARPRPCPSGDVVLSLSTSQENYTAGQLPQFNVDVVATAGQTCTFNVGARHVALIIRAGRVKVWSSADCVQGAGDLVSDLQRGVPTVLPISWNRQASSRGCPRASSRMPAGTYSAAVADGGLTSNSVAFRIS
ncbi:MAG TPA: hypothetical protein VMV07_23715 [Streptosporangiaceae bacterium]|nr:hypothetical protein [Streptosporangiaceae bacterium]